MVLSKYLMYLLDNVIVCSYRNLIPVKCYLSPHLKIQPKINYFFLSFLHHSIAIFLKITSYAEWARHTHAHTKQSRIFRTDCPLI